MAQLTRVANLPPDMAGLLDVHGDTLPVVDPRPRLGVASPEAHPDQRLILLATPGRYLLWVDRVDDVVSVDSAERQPVVSAGSASTTLCVTRIDGELVAVLSPAAFDPGAGSTAGYGASS